MAGNIGVVASAGRRGGGGGLLGGRSWIHYDWVGNTGIAVR